MSQFRLPGRCIKMTPSCLMSNNLQFSRHLRLPYIRQRRNFHHTSAAKGRSYVYVNHLRRELKSCGRGLASRNICPAQSCSGRRYKSSDEKQKDNDNHNDDINKAAIRSAAFGTFVAFIVNMVYLQRKGISFQQFVEDYLIQGRVQSVEVNTYFIGFDSAVAELKSNNPQEGRRIVYITTGRHQFSELLRQFEAKFNVPISEKIPIKHHGTDIPLLVTLSITFVSIVYLLKMAGVRMIRSGHLKSLRNESKQNRPKDEPSQKPEQTSNKNSADPPDGSSDMFDMLAKFMGAGGVDVKRGDQMLKNQYSFKDVAGLHEAKVEIMEFVDYIKHPEKFEEVGAQPPRGALLLGPPGCGKTLLAKALAAECDVPFFYAAGPEFIAMIGGVDAARIRALFKKAREELPCIIYIDEIDAIGSKRASSQQDNDSNDQLLNQLLTEMDGMKTQKGLIVLASTNRADTLDTALLRAGRFDRHIMIDYPTMMERVELFELYLSKLTLHGPVSSYAPRLAQLTPGTTGADIANICNEGAMHAASLKQKEVTAIDLEFAVEKSVVGKARKNNPLSQSERKVIAYHESGHALVGWMLEHTDALLKVTIIPRTNKTLGFAQYTGSDAKILSSDQLFDQMCLSLGGLAAETVIFHKTSTGSQNDLKAVTELAYKQIQHYGMSKAFGLLSFPTDQEIGMKGMPRPFSKKLAAQLDREARQLVASAYKRSEQLLRDNQDKLHALAAQLLSKETLQNTEVEAILGPPPFEKYVAADPSTFYDEQIKKGHSAREKREEAEEKERKETEEKLKKGQDEDF